MEISLLKKVKEMEQYMEWLSTGLLDPEEYEVYIISMYEVHELIMNRKRNDF